ncbi:MAG: endopeptidase La [Paludibacteraceae bacterium]|nr:endopeptidase La [Paludibacteraceae bacterium]
MSDKFNNQEPEMEFVPIVADCEPRNTDDIEKEQSQVLALALRNMVLFPGVVLPVGLGRRKSLLAAKRAYKNKTHIAVFTQKRQSENNPQFDDLYTEGCLAQVVKLVDTPDGNTTAILQGVIKIDLDAIDTESDVLLADFHTTDDVLPDAKLEKSFSSLLDLIKETASEVIKNAGTLPPEVMFAVQNIESRSSIVNFICANFPFSVQEKITMLKEDKLLNRGMRLLTLLTRQKELSEIRLDIKKKAERGIDKQQKEYFLQQQMRAIREELGDGRDEDSEIDELQRKGREKKWSKKMREYFEKEISKLTRYPSNTLDYSAQMTYLETLVSLPWEEYSKDSLAIKGAQKVLDADHYGMEDIKERIIEHLAILKLKGDMKSQIICLYGPPGVGKTSLCKSIATALGRNYVRVALGGIHDESEIRGHRRTYVGAMPGRIIKALKSAGTSNPVFVLDEIDKVSHENGFHGSPESALLEVLDPEQNKNFHDNYLDVDYDLSKVMFIATANDISTIPAPLKDRMEFINITGYSVEEKIEIASRHIVPKLLDELCLKDKGVSFEKDAIKKIIEGYTRESGVRGLEKTINKVLRKLAKKIVLKEEYSALITEADVKEYLGEKEILHEIYEGNEEVGVVTGLAWTAVGGEILFIETSLTPSKAPKLTLTGQLGDVMKESATIALEYVKKHCDLLGVESKVFDETSVHLHVPDGSTPKDGPSAGITMATALASAFSNRKVKANLAMTGEITLRGKVTPVGGIKEKMLAAKRAGIKEIILSKDNQRDIDEINKLNESYLKGLTFHYVEYVKEVFDIALV